MWMSHHNPNIFSLIQGKHLTKIAMPQADSTTLEMVGERTPLVLNKLKSMNQTQTTAFHTSATERTFSDTINNRPSLKATVQAHTPVTTEINPASSTTTITFLPGITRAITSKVQLRFSKHSSLPNMADTSSRHASRALEIGQRSSPPKPSAWHESVHHEQLIRVFDTVADITARNPKYPKCVTSQVHSTLNAMIKRCPELAQGKVPLTPDWIEYVLGKALRPPFCTAAMMGRWEILASSGGARSMWGPW